MTESTSPTGDERPPPSFFHAASVLYFLLAVGAIVWIGLERGAIPLSLFVDPSTVFADLGLGLLVAGLLLAGWEMARKVSAAAAALDARLRDALQGITVPEAVVLALLSGFAEELFFRGAMQGSLGWFWATLTFAALHAGPDRILGLWSLFALVAGGLFAALTEWRGTIFAAVAAHIAVNGVQLVRLALTPPAPVPDVAEP